MFPSPPICDESAVDHGGLRRVNEAVTRDAHNALLNGVRSEWARQQLLAMNNPRAGDSDRDDDSDYEPPAEPEVTVVSVRKAKKKPSKKKAAKIRKQILKRNARSANTNKGLLCCRDRTLLNPKSQKGTAPNTP